MFLALPLAPVQRFASLIVSANAGIASGMDARPAQARCAYPPIWLMRRSVEVMSS